MENLIPVRKTYRTIGFAGRGMTSVQEGGQLTYFSWCFMVQIRVAINSPSKPSEEDFAHRFVFSSSSSSPSFSPGASSPFVSLFFAVYYIKKYSAPFRSFYYHRQPNRHSTGGRSFLILVQPPFDGDNPLYW